jgi:phage terminase large subunit-like protein
LLASRSFPSGIHAHISTRDLTAFSLVFPPEEGDESGDWYVLIWAWIPEGKLREASNEAGADYPGWVKSGLLRVVDGEAMEYGPVVEAIKQACAEFDVVEIGFDPYNANSTVNDLLEAGMNMVQFRQGFLSMSAGAKELERLIFAVSLLKL